MPRSARPAAFDAIALWVIPPPAPCANTYSAFASAGHSSNPETLLSPTGMTTGCGSISASRGIPLGGHRAGIVDVGREIDLAPLLALDVERPHIAVLGNRVDHPQIPDG